MARQIEFDALRGLLLLLMALTHLPTRVSVYANQPLGFVSAAEGFVFLSAFMAGCAYARSVNGVAKPFVRRKLWSRSLQVYAYHLLLLLFAFTIAAAFAALTGRPALRNLLTFYFESPVVAIISGSLLLYQPPLFDILPMYIVFLALTPLLLEGVVKGGWTKVLLLSVLLWVFAQVGGARWLFGMLVPSGVHFPPEVTGSFDMFAWQLLWVVGLRVGMGFTAGPARWSAPTPALVGAVVIAAAFLFWRHNVGGFWTALEPLQPWLNKWTLGPLRLINFAALAIVVTRLLLPVLAELHSSVLALLGRASLQVFCAHLLVCVVSLGLIVDDDTPLTLAQELLVLVLMLATMVFVAHRVTTTRERKKAVA